MKVIFLDAETGNYNEEFDLPKCGVYKYVSSPSFELLLLAVSVDGGPVNVYDIASGETLPDEIVEAIKSDSVKKYSFNAMFERVVLSKYLGLPNGTYLNPKSWFCDMVWSATLGLPLSLENVGLVLGIEKQKLTVGKDLIRYFCKPCEPTKSNGGRTRNLPKDSPEKWELFKTYNKRDVETEIEIHNRLAKFPVIRSEWDYYHLDQRINDYGILLDMDFVHHAISCDEKNSESNFEKAVEISGIENPNSPKQLKEWLVEQGLLEVDSLAKSEVKRLLSGATGDAYEILKLRQELAKSSIKKYIAMDTVTCPDNRARGLIQFYGTHTGRFAGRLIQVQNLVSNKISSLEEARELVREENLEEMQCNYGSISNVLSECIRTAFIPKEGHRFIVADFSQIESRVMSWITNEPWRVKAYEDGKDIYSETASRMFGLPVSKDGENSSYRKYGKIAELACSYGGGIGALKAFGATALGIKETELQNIITSWRNANPHIVKFWWDLDKHIKDVIVTKEERYCYGLKIYYKNGILFIKLPSGRSLAYCKPRLGINNFGSESIRYEGVGAGKKWELIDSYGPKFAENIVQAIARDILCESMKRLDDLGFKTTITVHDEVVLEVPNGVSSVDEVCSIMGVTPEWAKGLLLKADGYECQFYKKE